MKRFAVMTDVHGNIYALQAVLRDIKEQNVDFTVCTGDLIGIGPFSNQVCEWLYSLKDTEIVTGNHDEAVLALMNGEPYPESRINVKEHHQWIADRLYKRYARWLERLPRQIVTEIEARTFQFTHYPMDTKASNLPINEDPFDQIGPPNGVNFSRLVELEAETVLCFGHDHDDHHFSMNERVFFNPGALGCNNVPYARYGIIEVDNGNVRFIKRQVPYPMATYLEHLNRIDFPRKEVILKIFQKNRRTHHDTTETHCISSDYYNE
ncbi:metallophosphoesterase family protein [Halobacillus litoralis]|uniref:metallophosphoesterase family protein n=1 Tax=Halobacillus litoralis TaxID=45668 RepID=UPI001CFD7101|nr:metallophosphoesterase family protein [Halobacillus litoralis]WLR46432.1 metallophosphoesterase family protein [Halobacillus litoralis]